MGPGTAWRASASRGEYGRLGGLCPAIAEPTRATTARPMCLYRPPAWHMLGTCSMGGDRGTSTVTALARRYARQIAARSGTG